MGGPGSDALAIDAAGELIQKLVEEMKEAGVASA
jgi:hypothetical protein